MRILHISDLHIGHHNPHLLANLKTRAPVLKPNLILVTGDLAHHCDEESLAGARDYLQELAQLCSQSPNGVDPQLGSRSPSGAKQPETNQPKLLVIPGNHDCSLWGWVPVSATQREFRKVFGELPSSHFFPAEQVWIYGFNSATHGWSVRSNGKILGDDLKEFVAVATQLRKEHGTKFDYAYKIVALHHHPVPIGYDDKHARWLTLLNAAEFLEEMIKLDVDLIVHGHEHVHAQATFGRGLLKDDDKQLTIVSVGSLSHLKPGKDNNRFNLIHIEPHGEVYVDSYEGKGATFTTEYSDRFTACTRHQAEERKFKQAVADIGYAYERIELYSQLNMDGDAFRIVNCKGLHLHQSSQPILGRRIALPRTSGYIDLPQVFELDEQSQRRGDRAGPGCLDSAPLDLSGFLPGYAERGALRFCRCVGRA
ncbi:metallophosphoesterase [Bradyrhizobium barranii subsp. barranii]|uniref:Metallophosphoesterase n=1 Tax=Bradyrhizobium barranii subsp. barranii TaxID=2823807 RepID=A0A7Z0Q8B8_9BRAD|nr:metallophosphoesterase [Bradyrhizobium barranii]UGX94270.1 metallophosphoesterase [Bradyrhizobium barranii subsp. barranii]